MQIHELSPKHKSQKKKRIGRGGKKGSYSGRGVKGQKARAGRKLKPFIRDWIKKYPKLRGYRFKGKKEEITIVNIDVLERKFQEGEIVSPQILVEKRIVRKVKGKTPRVKILGRGELKKPLKIIGCESSQAAKEKIQKAGGKIEEI